MRIPSFPTRPSVRPPRRALASLAAPEQGAAAGCAAGHPRACPWNPADKVAPIADLAPSTSPSPSPAVARAAGATRAELLGRTRRLGPGCWSEVNRAALDGWLHAVARRPGPKVAVFDWDNTSMFGDIGMAVARFQLEHLRLRLSPEDLAATIPDEIHGIRTLAGGVSLANAREDVLTAYPALWPGMVAGDLEAARRLPEHRDFCARMLDLYDRLEATPGVGAAFAYPWLVSWLGGMTPAELRAIALEACEAARAEPRDRVTWRSRPGKAGVAEATLERGIGPQPELQDLFGALEAAGVAPHVVTASSEAVVRAVAPHLGYPISEARIFGMRLEADADGRFRTEGLAGYPITNGPGKVELIQRFLPTAPLLVAGDSDGDFDMLTGFPETEVRLIFNRNKGPESKIRALYDDRLDGPAHAGGTVPPAAARARARTNAPVTLLQGRDETAGTLAQGPNTRPRET